MLACLSELPCLPLTRGGDGVFFFASQEPRQYLATLSNKKMSLMTDKTSGWTNKKVPVFDGEGPP